MFTPLQEPSGSHSLGRFSKYVQGQIPCLFALFFSPVYPKVPVSSVETLKELQDHLICSRCSPRAEA